MLRALTVVAMVTALTLVATTAGAQSPEPVPTATADQIVFYGEVPAPPGTTVTVEYFLGTGLTVCGTSTTTPSTSGDPNISSFVVVVDAACAARAAIVGVILCWGVDLCGNPLGGPTDQPPVGGETIATGLLSLPEPGLDVPPNLPEADVGPDIALPETGRGQELQERSRFGWLLWAGVTLLAAGLAIGGMSLAVMRKR